ncbi:MULTISPECIES: metallopeptidase family protein [Corynebacterium]|uniref:metallopeptidase family protein n=1 Tax=Corynebacterium TaxID=1716 RepID=UPI000B23EA03|nr:MULTISPECIES: metallopeptidase family protein [Corynebacterium]MCT1441915.1 metallopeptidase family protein [Corynebacterium glucuronolyticum]
MVAKSRHGRHGRGPRGPILPHDVPRARTRSQLFDANVVEAYAPFLHAYYDQLSTVDVAVDTVPRMQLNPDAAALDGDIVADGPVPLGRIVPTGLDAAGHPTRPRIVIFRGPVQERATGMLEEQELITSILTDLVASYLGLDPEDINPGS